MRTTSRSPRPHVVHYVHADNGHGIARVVRSVADHMARMGCRVTLVAGTCSDPAPLPAGVTAVDLQGATARSVTAVPRLRRELHRLAPTVVFAHGNGPSRSLVLATRGMRGRPRVLGVEHNHYSSYPWNLRPLRDVLNRLLLPRLDGVVGVSPGVADDLATTFPALASKVVMVPSPLPRLDQIAQLAAAPGPHPWFDEDVPVITTVGHVHPRKDHRTLVRAVARVHEIVDGPCPRLLVVGGAGGPEARAVRQLVSDLGLDDHVDLVGEQENPVAYVARSTVFALSSRNEGLSLAILEALAAGVPVVSTDCPSGPAHVLEEGAHGLLVPVGDVEGLADALTRMIEDRPLRDRLASGGPSRAAAFAPTHIAQCYMEVAGIAVPPG